MSAAGRPIRIAYRGSVEQATLLPPRNLVGYRHRVRLESGPHAGRIIRTNEVLLDAETAGADRMSAATPSSRPRGAMGLEMSAEGAQGWAKRLISGHPDPETAAEILEDHGCDHHTARRVLREVYGWDVLRGGAA